MEINLKKKRIFFGKTPDEIVLRGGDITNPHMEDQGVKIKTVSQVVAMTGGAATVVVADARPAKKFILGITGRVITVVAGAALTTINIGDGSDADRYGAAILKAAGTEFGYPDATADPREWLTASDDIVFTAAAGVFSSGEIRLDVHYVDLDSPNA